MSSVGVVLMKGGEFIIPGTMFYIENNIAVFLYILLKLCCLFVTLCLGLIIFTINFALSLHDMVFCNACLDNDHP